MAEGEEDGNLAVSDEENEEVSILDRELTPRVDYDKCLVGAIVTKSRINFLAFRDTMAAVWQPLAGIAITELGERRYLFRFFHEVDINRVLEGCPWEFNRNLLVIYKLGLGEDPLDVPLHQTNFWVQVHGLQSGLMSESLARQLGNFIGAFVEYDSPQGSQVYRQFMRLRVTIDIRKPLKRKKKIKITESASFFARFQYERLPLFCFICGKLGHGEKFCQVRLQNPSISRPFGWDSSLRAPIRRWNAIGSQWLRKEDGSWLQDPCRGSIDDHEGGSDMEIHEESPIAIREGNKRSRHPDKIPMDETGGSFNKSAQEGNKMISSTVLAGAGVRPDQQP